MTFETCYIKKTLVASSRNSKTKIKESKNIYIVKSFLVLSFTNLKKKSIMFVFIKMMAWFSYTGTEKQEHFFIVVFTQKVTSKKDECAIEKIFSPSNF
jgi:hypothetical protein